jgi:hypothetical protein
MEQGAALKPLWKGGTPGNSFVDGDAVACNFGDLVMYDCPSGDSIEMDLPPAVAADVGKRIGFHYTAAGAKAIGTITLDPDGTDSIEGLGAGTSRVLDAAGDATPWFELTYDGNGRWNITKGLDQKAPVDFFIP